MSAYADLSTEAKESARPETRAMRSQLAAWQTVLQQPPGKPLALEHAVVLLFAVSKATSSGRFSFIFIRSVYLTACLADFGSTLAGLLLVSRD